MNLKRARRKHSNESGLLLADHYPPWGYKLAMARKDALRLHVVLDRDESLTLMQGTKTLDTFFDVLPDVPTTIELWPALEGITLNHA